MDAKISDITKATIPKTSNFVVHIKNEGSGQWLRFDTEMNPELKNLMAIALNAGVKYVQWDVERKGFKEADYSDPK